MKHLLSAFALCTLFLLSGCNALKKPFKRDFPNILWITSEDNSPMLGCYGDAFATTPHLDRLASEGFRYTRAYANAPVCAPARNTILTGVHACSNGNEQMRSTYAKSDLVRPYTEYLMEKGYYCTNNSKTDYNFKDVRLDEIWDECGTEAHYRNRAEGQPFFAIFNLTTSHESCIHQSIPDSALRHNPADVVLPPYHPDTPELRHDWAQYYDKVEDMDTQVGRLLDELEEAGLAENTIVFYYSDHGGILGRSKRFLYETGTHVPLIVRIPERYRKLFPADAPGAEVDRLVSFVDLAPTLLSLAGTEAPDYMQGRAFLGKHLKEPAPYVYMFRDRMDERYDMSRSVTDGTCRYIRNFDSDRIYMQHLEYLWRAPSMRSWEQAFLDSQCNEVQSRYWGPKPVEELYDSKADPWEVNNLAGDPGYRNRLVLMREACIRMGTSMRDAGFIPEADRISRTGDLAAYDYLREEGLPYEKIIQAAYVASSADPERLDQLISWLDDEDSAVRYWAIKGLLLLGEGARPYLNRIVRASFDPSQNVCITAADLLSRLGETESAEAAYLRALSSPEPMARTAALNSIDLRGGSREVFLDTVVGVLRSYDTLDRQFDARAAKWLLEKWEVDPGEYGVDFSW